MKFGFESFGLSKKTPERQPDPEVAELLEEKVRTIAAGLPEAAGMMNDLNVAMTANALMTLKEREGAPYTAEEIEALGPEFDEQVREVFRARIAAQSDVPAQRETNVVVNRDGFVVGSTGSMAEVGEIAATERAEQDQPE